MHAGNHHQLGSLKAGLVICVVVAMPGWALAQKIAQGGSPLYSYAVHESVESLKASGKAKAAEEAKVCPICGKVHSSVAVGGTNQVAAAPSPEILPINQPCPICGKVHAPAQSAGHTNMTAAASALQASGAGRFASEFYYCPNCRVYHRRKGSVPTLALPEYRPLLSPGSLQTNASTAGRH
jgi:hypothetical protein